jgi:2-polyprenyl-3-methyl-5-hydroxy-6-metoxy-1,4-benzoquinol methylase
MLQKLLMICLQEAVKMPAHNECSNQNKLGERIYSIPQIAKDKVMINYIAKSLRGLFSYLGYEGSQLEEIMQRTIASFDENVLEENSVKRGDCLDKVEYNLPKELLDFYEKVGYREKRGKRNSGRAEKMFQMVQPYLNGKPILDVGTGNSTVAVEIHNSGHRINTMDVTDNRCEEARQKEKEGLSFSVHSCDEHLRYKPGSYGTVMTMAVLHHCDEPLRLLDDAVNTSNSRLIIYESTFGANGKSAQQLIKSNPEVYEEYFSLDREQQKMYCIFLDWFLNKIEYLNDAHIPCNFTSPDRWEEIFREKGLEVRERKLLGFDNPGISEFHVLYVLEKAES